MHTLASLIRAGFAAANDSSPLFLFYSCVSPGLVENGAISELGNCLSPYLVAAQK
jgi:hypothetical protein